MGRTRCPINAQNGAKVTLSGKEIHSTQLSMLGIGEIRLSSFHTAKDGQKALNLLFTQTLEGGIMIIARGLDGRLYIVFNDNVAAYRFKWLFWGILRKQQVCFDGYENAFKLSGGRTILYLLSVLFVGLRSSLHEYLLLLTTKISQLSTNFVQTLKTTKPKINLPV